MNWTVIILEAVILTLAFTAMVLIPCLIGAGIYAWLF